MSGWIQKRAIGGGVGTEGCVLHKYFAHMCASVRRLCISSVEPVEAKEEPTGGA